MNKPVAIEVDSESPPQTREIGRCVGELLIGGEVIELNGPLGAGKTQFAKGLAVGLGVPEGEPVVSPTFVLVREYAGRLNLLHCDAYRLGSVDELLDLGLEEALEDGAVVAIEWADRFPESLSSCPISVEIDYGPDVSTRVIAIRPPTEHVAAALRASLKKSGCIEPPSSVGENRGSGPPNG